MVSITAVVQRSKVAWKLAISASKMVAVMRLRAENIARYKTQVIFARNFVFQARRCDTSKRKQACSPPTHTTHMHTPHIPPDPQSPIPIRPRAVQLLLRALDRLGLPVETLTDVLLGDDEDDAEEVGEESEITPPMFQTRQRSINRDKQREEERVSVFIYLVQYFLFASCEHTI